MTSSLVGSEMCIRDRLRDDATLMQTTKMATTDEDEQQDNDQQLEDTVSYTHLTLPTICSV
eukprot:2489453-Prorocentrum_lima.AAC.1